MLEPRCAIDYSCAPNYQLVFGGPAAGPEPSALATRFGLSGYGLNLLLLGVVSYSSWAYAERHGLVTRGALTCFINTYLSIFIIIAVQLSMVFVFNSGARAHEAGAKAE